MTTNSLRSRALKARIEVAERTIGIGGAGWEMLAAVVAAWSIVEDPEHSPIVGIEVDGPDGRRVTIQRRPGETVDQLHARANPLGGLRVRPRPVRAHEAVRQSHDVSLGQRP
jgi:hypothetical protein